MKIHLVVTDFFYADGRPDGQADMMKLTVAFHNFSHSSKMGYYLLYLFCTLGKWQKFFCNIYGSINSKGM